MPDSSLLILYVDNPKASAALYAGLLGSTPIEASETFVLIPLRSGGRLGLWSRHTVEPHATAPGGVELAFPVADLQAAWADWTARGLRVAQPPTDLDFGRTFVVLDPDGHRLRAYVPPAS